MGPALEPDASEASPAASGARVAAPYVRAFLFITSLQLLLVPCYKSTDFEVRSSRSDRARPRTGPHTTAFAL